MVLLDIYVFQAVKVITYPASSRHKIRLFIAAYWVDFGIGIRCFTDSSLSPFCITRQDFPYYHFCHRAGVVLCQIDCGCFLLLVDDVRRGIQWAVAANYFFKIQKAKTWQQEVKKISRSVFLSWAG